MKLSVIVITKDEEKLIKDCLESVRELADEIIVLDTGSTDRTIEIAKEKKAKIFSYKGEEMNFSAWRNEALKKAIGDWVFYLDADERVTKDLKEEIEKTIEEEKFNAYAIPRQNYYLGKAVRFGGSYPDYVKRLFKRENHKGWKGELHEEPIFLSASGGEGELGHLENPMIHLTHRNLSSMVEKTNKWSEIEAKLLYDAGHPEMVWWRFLRIMLTEFWYRGIKLQGFRDKDVGFIEVIFQVFSRFMTYAKLWEIQQLENKDK